MDFFVQDWRSLPFTSKPVYAQLRRDRWDDFGFKTLFDLTVVIQGSVYHIGQVKILHATQEQGLTPLPKTFSALSDAYISLGQEYSYYENLVRLGSEMSEEILTALQDIVRAPSRLRSFSNQSGIHDSLLRFAQANAVLETAPSLLSGQASEVSTEPVVLEAETSVGGNDFRIEFRFITTPYLPNRINVVIGYNGTGKTELLGKLARLAAETGVSERQDHERGGRIVENSLGTFAAIIAISYSALDAFELPSRDVIDQVRRSGSFFGYTYIGLREEAQSASSSTELRLKPLSEVTRDFQDALTRAHGRVRVLGSALRILSKEPSFQRVGLAETSLDDVIEGTQLFRRLSTGHKMVLNIVVHLVSQLQPRTLVLIDEPEVHLHPPLVAALLGAVTYLLETYESMAIVATHSPVVLQEVPGKQVRILRRFGDVTTVERPEIETYGETIGNLTRTIFNLDSSATDYQRVLRELADRYSATEIEQIFGGQLSNQARALLIAYANDGDPGDE